VTLEWPEGNRDDIDPHLLLPDQKALDFHNRQAEHAMLDRDDVGINGFYTWADGKTVHIPEHKEVISLRAIVPGAYVANVHVLRVSDSLEGSDSDPKLPDPVKVRLLKLNPRVEELAVAEILLSRVGSSQRTGRLLSASS